MKKWKVKDSRLLHETPHFSVVKDTCVDFAGQDRDYYKVVSQKSGHVMVVPVKVIWDGDHGSAQKDTCYIMVEQYRHGCEQMSLEFPAGRIDAGETAEQAARRELREETGYEAKNLKFLYMSNLNVVRGPDTQAIFLAEVEGDPHEPEREPTEVGAGMRVVELSSADLHKKVLDNEVQGVCTLAALCTVLLQSKKATQYLGGPNPDRLPL